MADTENTTVPLPICLKPHRYLELEAFLTTSTFWCFMKPRARPSFTRELLADLSHMGQVIQSMFETAEPDGPPAIETFVLGSRATNVFNLGGDLSLFAEAIRSRDWEALCDYAQACVTAGYANYIGYGRGVVTIALVQGHALGGGLEAALCCDVLIAERHAKLGLPEMLFNLFPGMGAYSHLSRRVGSRKAEEIILGGKTYTAREMHQMGVVDVLAEPGEGHRATLEYIARNRSRHLARSAVYKVRRRVNPVPLQELRDIADLWVDTALRLSEADLRKMLRISELQGSLYGGNA